MRQAERLVRREFLAPLEVTSRVVPRRIQRWVGWPVAVGLLAVLREAREGVARNIATIGSGRYSSQDVRRLTVRTFHRYGQYLLDYLAIPHLGRRRLRSLIRRKEGADRLTDLLRLGEGAIVVTPHLGHWELGGALLASEGYPVTVVTAPERDPGVLRLREWMRRRMGIRTLTLLENDSGFSLLPVLGALRENRIVAMLVDRPRSGARMEVPFFGRSTPFPLGPAVLARASGAPLVPVFVTINEEWTYDTIAQPPIRVERSSDREQDLLAATTSLAQRFEVQIARHPDQWYNFFDFWPGGRTRVGGERHNP